MTDDEFLYGIPGATYRGLWPILTERPLPPSAMTRQRRRADARAEAKAARSHAK